MGNLIRYSKLSRRRVATLTRWWHELNEYKWPKELGAIANIKQPANKSSDLYWQMMQEIQGELGRRVLLERGIGAAKR
jgi:hypothetical protein